MGGYRCPSTSDVSTSTGRDQSPAPQSDMGRGMSCKRVNGPRVSENATVGPACPRDVLRRKRSGMSPRKKEKIEMSKKKEFRRVRIHRYHTTHVFIGNVQPTVTESILEKVFFKCGTIVRIQIRCSQGRAVTIGQAIPNHQPTDHQYATVEFENTQAVRKALKLNGIVLHGAQLLVCLSAAHLPEVDTIVRKRHYEVQQRCKPHTLRFLRGQPTEQDLGPRLASRSLAKNVFMGISFPKTLM